MNCKLFNLAILTLLFLAACKSSIHESLEELDLNTNWEFRGSIDSIWKPAIVPGDVVVNLLANKIISDTQIINHPESINWVEKEDWEYRLNFDVNEKFYAHENLILQFKGLDKNTDVYLNDSLIIKANKFLRSIDVPCKHVLKIRNNKLQFYFHSAFDGEDTMSFAHKYPYQIPKILTLGIYKPVILQGWSNVKIEDVYFSLLSLSEKEAEYNAEISILSSKEQIVNLEILVDQKHTIKLSDLNLKQGINKQLVSFNIRNPKLWWVNGLGKSNLYNITVRLTLSNSIAEEKNTELGIRRLGFVDLNYDSMYFKLNGIPVYIKGAILMPPDLLISRVSTDIYRKIVQDAKDAHINLLRVCGEGFSPDDAFYNLCDENGILVWHDFISSGLSDSDSTKMDNFMQEYSSHIQKYRNHACFVMLPLISQIKNQDNFKRFQIDFAPKSLTQDIVFKNTQLEVFKNLSNVFGVSDNKAIVYLSQVYQSLYLKNNIESARITKPVNMGYLFWNFNDSWPIVSGSIKDYYGNYKPAYYTVKNEYDEVIVVATRKKGYIEIIGVNDAFKDADAILLCKLIDFYGNSFYVKQIPVKIRANSSQVLLRVKESEVLSNQNPLKTCFLVQLNQPGQTIAQSILYFGEPEKIQLPAMQIIPDITESTNGFNLILKSNVLVRNLVMQTKMKEAVFSDNNIDILPDKRYKIQVQYNGTKEDLEKDLEIQSLNEYCKNK